MYMYTAAHSRDAAISRVLVWKLWCDLSRYILMKIKQLQTSCCFTQLIGPCSHVTFLIGPYCNLCKHCITLFTNVITVCKDEQVSCWVFTACNVSGTELTNDLCKDSFSLDYHAQQQWFLGGELLTWRCVIDLGGELLTWGWVIDLGGELSTWGWVIDLWG